MPSQAMQDSIDAFRDRQQASAAVQGRYGVPDSFPGHAARCHQKPLPAAGRGIYVGWLAADLTRVEPGRWAVVCAVG
jgi:hypothetical protein